LFIKLKIVFLMGALFCASGCGLSEIKSQNQSIEAENRRVYKIYQEYMQSMNEESVRSGVSPRPIMPYESWRESPGTD
jgi:hypothetical protein